MIAEQGDAAALARLDLALLILSGIIIIGAAWDWFVRGRR